ncbi:MAG: SGNH/GDSL hydrolase family protein [Acidobacteriota bacterium]
MRPLVARLGLVTAGSVVALVLAEIVVRLFGLAPQVAFIHRGQFRLSDNDRIGWEPIPDPGSAGATEERGWNPSERNGLGFRDRDHALDKPPGVYRILVLGDSITKGLGVPDKERIFPAVLERKLDESGLTSEVINFGVEGYNTQQEVETLEEKGLVYKPDLVVLAYSLNDRDWPAHHLYREMLEQEFHRGWISDARISPFLAPSALYRFLRYRVLARFPRGSSAIEETIRKRIDLVQQDTVEEYFGVLADLARSNRFDVLVAVFPYLDDLVHYRHNDQHEWVRVLSSRHGFHHLDLLDPLTRCQEFYHHEVAADDVHPNILGHNCAGITMADFIEKRIVPGAKKNP